MVTGLKKHYVLYMLFSVNVFSYMNMTKLHVLYLPIAPHSCVFYFYLLHRPLLPIVMVFTYTYCIAPCSAQLWFLLILTALPLAPHSYGFYLYLLHSPLLRTVMALLILTA